MKWFKHETDAHTNLKLQVVIEKFGMAAYGYYWVCDEIIGLQGENFQIKSSKSWKNYLKKMTGVDYSKQEEYLDFFGEMNLIDRKALKKGHLSIPKLEERSDDYTKRLRRESEPTTVNVHLEEKREEENKTEEIRLTETGAPSPKEKSLTFFQEDSIQEQVVANLVSKGVPRPAAESEIKKFIAYWTEPNSTGKRQRWQDQKYFDLNRRITTWLTKSGQYQRSGIQSKIAST